MSIILVCYTAPTGTAKLTVYKAVRFRVYAYDKEGEILGEINNAQDYRLTWTVHVANKKAAYSLFRGMISLAIPVSTHD